MPWETRLDAQRQNNERGVNESHHYQQGSGFAETRNAGKGGLPPAFSGFSVVDGAPASDAPKNRQHLPGDRRDEEPASEGKSKAPAEGKTPAADKGEASADGAKSKVDSAVRDFDAAEGGAGDNTGKPAKAGRTNLDEHPDAANGDAAKPAGKVEPPEAGKSGAQVESDTKAGAAGSSGAAKVVTDGNGGRTTTTTGSDGTKTESYAPGTAHSSTTDASGKVLYSDSVDKAGNYTQSGVTKDGGAWTMTSDKNGPTSSQNWGPNETSSWSKDATTGNTTSIRSENKGSGAQSTTMDATRKITDQQKWSTDGKTYSQANPTADGGSVSRTYDANGKVSDYQRWQSDGSLMHSGTDAQGNHFSVASDAKGNVTGVTSRDQDNNYTKSGPTHEGGAYSETRNASGQVTDSHFWGKDGYQYQGGVSAKGDSYSQTTNAAGTKSEFRDKSGTSNYSYDSSGSTSKLFVPADGNMDNSYKQTTDANGGTAVNPKGSTSWDNKGGGSFTSADKHTDMTWHADGSGSYKDLNGNVSWNGKGDVSRSGTEGDGTISSRTTDAQGHTLDKQTYDSAGNLTQSAGPNAPGGPYIMHSDAAGNPTYFTDRTGTHQYSYKNGQTTDSFSPKPIVTTWGAPGVDSTSGGTTGQPATK